MPKIPASVCLTKRKEHDQKTARLAAGEQIPKNRGGRPAKTRGRGRGKAARNVS